jgi:hypothetical protein
MRRMHHGHEDEMLGRATYALCVSSHGRFFFRPSAVAKFLRDEPG